MMNQPLSKKKSIVIEVDTGGEDEKEEKSFDKYEVEDGLRTLIKAEEIKANKALMKEISAHAGSMKKVISSLSDLKKAYKDVVAKEKSEGDAEEKSESEDEE